MKILALETTTTQGGVAISAGGQLVAEYSLHVPTNHTAHILSAIQTLFTDAGLTIADMDGFAISIGPGSFTGLRVGLATVKGLAYATGKPVVSVPTLEALAWPFCDARYLICPCLDARKKEVYAAVFDMNGHEPQCVFPATVAEPRSLLQHLADTFAGQSILFVGNGVTAYYADFMTIMGERLLVAPAFAMQPRAAVVAHLGLKKMLKGETEDMNRLEPLYLRKSEAEIKWQERQRAAPPI